MDTAVDAPYWSPEAGEFLPSQASRLAEILRDYNHYLELVYIPRSQRDDTDTHPFGILDKSPAHAPYIVRHLSEREVENPAQVLAWLFEGDLSKHRAVDLIDRERIRRDAEQILARKRDAEISEERQELAAAIMSGGRDHKNEFRHNGKIFNDKGARRASSTVY